MSAASTAMVPATNARLAPACSELANSSRRVSEYTTPRSSAATTAAVGIGRTSPATKLDVAGTVRVADGAETCSATVAGGIRYTATVLQYCDGTAWQLISSTGSGGTPWSSLTAPTADLSIAMAAYKTNFVWGAATGASNLFTLTDTASNSGTGYLLNAATATVHTLRISIQSSSEPSCAPQTAENR